MYTRQADQQLHCDEHLQVHECSVHIAHASAIYHVYQYSFPDKLTTAKYAEVSGQLGPQLQHVTILSALCITLNTSQCSVGM